MNTDKVEERETSAQAAKVFAWLEYMQASTEAPKIGEAEDPHLLSVAGIASVKNGSDQPIYEVFGVPPIEHEAKGHLLRSILLPGQVISIDTVIHNTYVSPGPIRVQFRDNAGHWWVRDEAGVLRSSEAGHVA